ncbi:hypothetical protein ACIRQF_07865 [Streptomyces sp. NPDC101191]|uniref:MmyB family transcriptional regulator n=1 Tax=Streptomyces sp. NPDC101191 TaxID=3366126 RepID=UPI003813ADD3
MPVPRRVLDPGAQHFVADWGQAVTIATALLRARGRPLPERQGTAELIGELSTSSTEFRTRRARGGLAL